MCASSCATGCAIARTAVSIVPSAGSRTESVGRVRGARQGGPTRAPGRRARRAATRAPRRRRARPATGSRRCCRAAEQRGTRHRAHDLVAADRSSARSSSSSSSSTTARRVSAMLSPVSPSATGKTLRSLTSCRRRSSSGARPRRPAEADRGCRRPARSFFHQRRGSGGLGHLPAFRQRVQTYSRQASPTSMRTFCRFGSKRRLVATIEWQRLCPNAGPCRRRTDLCHRRSG